MRLVGNRRAKELYRRGAATSWQPNDSKERKVKLCTELYGTEAVQRAVKQNIQAASCEPGTMAGSAAPARDAGYITAPLVKEKQDSPNWLDDWTDLGVTSKGDLDEWLSHPISVPISPVMQHGELASLEKQMVVQNGHGPVSQHEDDLAVVFGSNVEVKSAGKPTVPQANPFRCSMQTSDREKDFWDSVNWDDLLS